VASLSRCAATTALIRSAASIFARHHAIRATEIWSYTPHRAAFLCLLDYHRIWSATLVSAQPGVSTPHTARTAQRIIRTFPEVGPRTTVAIHSAILIVRARVVSLVASFRRHAECSWFLADPDGGLVVCGAAVFSTDDSVFWTALFQGSVAGYSGWTWDSAAERRPWRKALTSGATVLGRRTTYRATLSRIRTTLIRWLAITRGAVDTLHSIAYIRWRGAPISSKYRSVSCKSKRRRNWMAGNRLCLTGKCGLEDSIPPRQSRTGRHMRMFGRRNYVDEYRCIRSPYISRRSIRQGCPPGSRRNFQQDICHLFDVSKAWSPCRKGRRWLWCYLVALVGPCPPYGRRVRQRGCKALQKPS
jgi:hypothetical protein